jgi:hypothetical protein
MCLPSRWHLSDGAKDSTTEPGCAIGPRRAGVVTRDVRARPAPSQRTGPRGPLVPGEAARQADVSGGARSEGDRKVASVVERGGGTRRAVSVGRIPLVDGR